MMRIALPFFAALIALSAAPAAPATPRDAFPRPPALEPDVQFWVRVYSEVSTRGGLVHDSRNLSVVYEVLHFPEGQGPRAQQKQVDGKKRHYRRILRSLARGKRQGLSSEEARVLGLWPEGVANKTLRAASRQLRFQLGQADKFRAGLIRAGEWEPHISETLEEMGLPKELAVLPHVESSYTAHAYSRVGAAGLWQFTRSTGRRYLRVDPVVDERMDPFRATRAAGRLLEQNYKTTGSWPLAITAYNHGASGVRRAIRKMGTRDISEIVRNYRSRSFGFASRNFYIEFLAASEVEHNSEKYFGPLPVNLPVEYASVEMPYYTSASALQRALAVEISVLKRANPALRPSVWRDIKRIPRGFEVRVPRDQVARPLQDAIGELAESDRFARQRRDTFHTVRRGETLSKIAGRYRVSVDELVALNGLRSRHRIRQGQRLRLPDDGRRSPSRARARGTRAKARPAAAPPALPPEDGMYTVRRGDTLAAIATRFGIREVDLQKANALRSRDRILVGQTLRVDVDGVAGTIPTSPHPHAVIAVARPRPEAAMTRKASPAALPLAPAASRAGTAPRAADLPAPEEAEVEYGPVLAADPSDYSVASDGTIEIQAAETLGHYAEWLNTRASQLRRINQLRYSDPLVIGHRLRLDFDSVSQEEFENFRLAYHDAIQGQFFQRYEIAGTRVHVMRRGDSIWLLSHRRFRVPIWLLRQYNPDLDFASLQPGVRVTVPLLRLHDEPSPAVDTETAGSAAGAQPAVGAGG